MIGESLDSKAEKRAKPGTKLFEQQERYWKSGYYGRGFVQITWKLNYKKFGYLLGLDLVKIPYLALDKSIAAKILCVGMSRGLFTGNKISDYI